MTTSLRGQLAGHPSLSAPSAVHSGRPHDADRRQRVALVVAGRSSRGSRSARRGSRSSSSPPCRGCRHRSDRRRSLPGCSAAAGRRTPSPLVSPELQLAFLEAGQQLVLLFVGQLREGLSRETVAAVLRRVPASAVPVRSAGVSGDWWPCCWRRRHGTAGACRDLRACHTGRRAAGR